MKCNVGKTDRMFRIILGVIIILAGIYFKSWWGAVGLLLYRNWFYQMVSGIRSICIVNM